MNIFFRNITKNINFLPRKIKAGFRLLTFFCILAIIAFMINGYAQAAVIPGEGVPHIVDSPAGEIESTDNVYNAAVDMDTAADDSAGYTQSEPEAAPETPQRRAEKKQEMPEVPNFDSNLDGAETVKHPKNNNNTYIIIGLVILLVGIGLIFVAKSRRE